VGLGDGLADGLAEGLGDGEAVASGVAARGVPRPPGFTIAPPPAGIVDGEGDDVWVDGVACAGA
jgi:hypothetical protein